MKSLLLQPPGRVPPHSRSASPALRPDLPRIECLIRLPDGQGGVINRARLSAGSPAWVEWRSATIDPRLRRGRPVLLLRDLSAAPARIQSIHGLLPLELPLP